MNLLKLPQIANNIELLLGDFFTATYSEHRGPIQTVHQIERVRSSPFFESDDFYRLIAQTEFQRGGTFNQLDRAIDVAEANVKAWRGYVIGRKIELASAGRWTKDTVTLGDAIWAAYLHIVTGGNPTARSMSALYEYIARQMVEDDGNFYHATDWNVHHLEGKTVVMLATDAIERLKVVS